MYDFKPPYLGAAYYPESWPREEIDADLDRLVSHGLNTVRIAEFAWSTMEPKEGKFDFSLFREVVDKCKALVERFGGTITEVDEWGKKRLAYEVQKMKEAFYYFIRFEAEATAPAEIESRIRIMDNVIRYLCVRQDEA